MACQENESKMQEELNKKDLYTEELEYGIKEIRLQRQQALKELEISEKYGLKLLKQTTEYRMVSKGNVIHFCAKCSYYGRARGIELCQICQTGGTVLDFPERAASQA